MDELMEAAGIFYNFIEAIVLEAYLVLKIGYG